MHSKTRGTLAEQQACDYLRRQGLTLITQNFQCRLGEIDLIMRDKSTLVFVEVRYRRHNNYGDGIESITYPKQQRIIKTASYYLIKHNSYDKIACRFDVIAMTNNAENPIHWIKNAFLIN